MHSTGPLTSVERVHDLLLSYAQQRLWFLAQLDRASTAYHISGGLRLRGTLDSRALRAALDRIVLRHEALRTVFVFTAEQAVQRIVVAEQSRFELIEHDLRLRSDMQAELERLGAQEAGCPFDLSVGPLIRGRLIRISEDEHVLLITMHHIVSDGWSMGIFWNELSALYSAFLAGGEDPLPELEIQYADYAVWQRQWIEGEILQQQAGYWKSALAGVPALLELPADHPRPAQQDFGGAFAELVLDERLTSGLKQLSRRHGTTLYMTLLAAWAALLSRLSGQQDIVIGSPVANRGRAEIENLIGFFVNTLALRLDLSGAPSVVDLLGRAKAQAIAAQQHQDIPFEQVVELLQPVRSLSHSPLFQIMFAWQNVRGGSLALPGLEVLPLQDSPHRMAKFDLELSLQEAGDMIAGGVEYATSLFEPPTMQRYLGYFRNLLEAMVADDTQLVDRLPILGDAERHRVLYEWNETKVEFPSDKCVHQLFEEQVAKTPDAVAVVYEDHHLSYGELNRKANQMAHYLRHLGVRPDDRVAICVERSLEMIVALLAVLKAGGAYVPLDPAYPVERLRFMLQDSTPVALLTQKHLKQLFAGWGKQQNVLDLNDEHAPWLELSQNNPDLHSMGLTSSHLAYIIYTSGSTGTPKGVMVQHSNVARLFGTTEMWFKFAASDIWTLFHSYSFDFSVWEIWGALLYGGRLIVVSNDIARSPDEFYALICREGVTVLNQTPSAFQRLISVQSNSGVLHRLRCVVFGGEALEPAMLKSWYERNCNRDTQLINMYGITETTVHVTYRPLGYEDTKAGGPSPIGCPLPDLRAYILDAYGEPVPVGVAGELYIGGVGVARGYLNRPDLTAERFVEDPFVAESGGRMYRTGDLGRWLPDGNIEFVGRDDFQVKIRGFRIELGEIEARLREHAGVREAVVVAGEDGDGGKRLVAYYTTLDEREEGVGAEPLRSHLSACLPEYMVPAAYVRLEAMPLTPNGKLDRKALPVPDADAYSKRIYEAPQGEIETRLAEIWAEVLKQDKIGRHDNFFELGGHSLLAVRLITRLRQALCVELAIRDLFAHPVLADLARALQSAAGTELPAIGPVQRDAQLPLSYAQQRLWFLAQLDRASTAYHISGGLRLRGTLDSRALRAALDRIVLRHEALRTVFVFTAEQAVQRIVVAEQSRFELIEHDLRLRSDMQAELERLGAQEAGCPFDLSVGPLIRGRLIRISEDEHVLLITMHHIVSDGWSMGIFWNELSALYSAFLAGGEDPLPELEIQYADYAVWQRQWIEGEILQQQAGYWKSALAGVPALLELPADHPRPAQQDFGGAFAELVLDERLTSGLKQLSRRHGTTLYMTLLAAWAALLSRLSGQQDIVIGSPVANRGRAEIENLIGFFVNTLALRLDLSGAPSVVDLLGRVKAQAIAAQQHQDIPFEQVVELLQPVRSLSHSPLFQILFAWQNAEEGSLALPGLEVLPLQASPHRMAKFDLELSLQEAGDMIAGGVEYATSLFEPPTMQRYLGYFRNLLEAMVADDTQLVDRLPILGDAERHRVLYEWNETKVEFPSDKCVHQLFEEQVAKTPDAVAVVYEDHHLSYGELNRKANQMAHYLRHLGVRPDDRVAICVERSLEMIVALLAVLKAGGAYVPLDPAYPVERLRFMLQDSTPVALLTQKHLKQLFAGWGKQQNVLDLNDEHAPWLELSQNNPDLHSMGLTSSHLAYIIYTSGSTGTPKGVMVQHSNVARLFGTTEMWFKFAASDIWTLFHSYSFDFSVWEIWGALLYGGRLIVVSNDIARSPDEFYALICREGVTVLNQTPSAFQRLISVQSNSGVLHRLRCVVFGGEALEPAMLKSWYERNCNRDTQLINMYGITETTVHVTYRPLGYEDTKAGGPSPIGCPLPDLRAYILDAYGEPVPVGVAGELYIGGVGVARGYLNRPDLTAERFVEDPFVAESGGRMYRTGDLGRWLPDGNIEFVGRDDFQVKIRGFRIELGEIEARLREHAGVREAVVVAGEDGDGGKRLVAYYTTLDEREEGVGAEPLRSHLSACLPEYMVPAAYVRLEAMPLTPNGKLDRKALPAPDADAYSKRIYEAPQGEIETRLAEIWAEVLKQDKIGRHDNFFELGGHSLLAVTLIERMRRNGLKVDVRTLFAIPTLAALAASVDTGTSAVQVPPNLIPSGCEAVLPEMLPLIALTAGEIEGIVSAVPGGAANVQDIYPLAPLQEGILFHHLMETEGDPYLQAYLFSFDTRARLDSYIGAIRFVIDRHDILRTAVLWEGLPEPVQVVWRQAFLEVEEVEVAGDDASQQLYARFDPRHFRIDVRRAPLFRMYVTYDRENDRWLLLQLLHHLMDDNTSFKRMQAEVQAYLLGQAEQLPAPLPFRNLVAQARQGISREEHEAFFRKMLGDVDEPTAPFGLLDVHGDGTEIEEAHLELDNELARRLRAQARRMGVSAASLCHLAWAQVLAKVSGREDVVFGTVLFGRMQGSEGSDRVMGLFINTLPVRISIDEEGAEAGVRRTHALLADLLRHEHASLVLAQRCSAVPAPAPLFSALLNYRHTPAQMSETSHVWQGIQGIRGQERTNYPFGLSVNDLGEGFSLDAQTHASVDPVRICEFMRTALVSLSDALETAPSTPLRRLEVLPAPERHRVLYEWNETKVEFPSDKCVHQLFEEQVVKTPDAVAVVYEDHHLSYGELNRKANQMAHYLRHLGVRPDDRVAICVERSLEMIVALLAVLKAGGAYVPLDPAYPVERLRFMLQDSTPVALLTQKHLKQLFAGWGKQQNVLDLNDEHAPWLELSQNNPDLHSMGLTSSHLAYIIYTSGSTGTPKGVMVQHNGVSNTLLYTARMVGIRSDDVIAAIASSAFDISVLEMLTAWLGGAQTLLVSKAAVLDMEQLSARLRTTTVLHSIPILIAQIADSMQSHDWNRVCLRMLMTGGDFVSRLVLEKLQTVLPDGDIRVLYGPTEASMICTTTERLNGQSVHQNPSIGRPIANMRVYILDAHGEPVPVGVAGELYIGGVGVARGYLNRPDLTAERFVEDPFVAESGGRMYRTGDLGRWLPDGNIEFVGRDDFQVKIRGFRIELGEIEARLREHAGVREAVVVAGEDGDGGKRLVAYYTTLDEREEGVGAEPLRSHLSACLPEYMVPAAYVRLEAMPLTPNGKLDRKALPAPDADAYSKRIYEAPQGEIETRLAEIWAEVLKQDKIGRHDNFFELGGHSLLAVRLITRLRQALCVELAIRDLFAHPVLADLARALQSAAGTELPAIGPVQRDAQLPLSYAQQRLWFLAQLDRASTAYHISGGLRLRGTLDSRALRAALDRIVLRHEALRTVFVFTAEQAVQRIVVAEQSRFELIEHDLRLRSDMQAELERLGAQEAGCPFDLSVGPLIRGRLIRISEDEHVLLITMHHVVSDGWSMGIFWNELSALYSAFLAGGEDPLPELEIQYADYAVWQRQWIEGEILQQQAGYWKSALAGVPALLELPADHPRPAQQDFGGAFAELVLDERLTSGLKQLSRRHGTTLYMTLLAAWAALLSRLSGQQDIVIGSPVANRGRAEIENLIGFFVNTLALRLDLSGAPSVVDLLGRAKAQAIAAQQHQDIPFEQVVELLQPVRSLSHSPLFQILFAWQNAEEGSLALPGLEVLPLQDSLHRMAKFDLELSLQEAGDMIAGGVEYATSLFEPPTMQRYLGYFRNLLEAMVADDTQLVDRLPILGDAERHRVLYEWNETKVEFPSDKCVHQLFEEQVAKTPDAVAVVYEDHHLSYGELNRKANQMAHYLRHLGVRPDDRVAICVERSLEMIVALLAVLKAGGAYVPLDPAYPVERLRFMLQDSTPVALLTQKHLKQLFAGWGKQQNVLDLNDEHAPWLELSQNNPDLHSMGLTSSHLAYIIYTSGSTGTPKGVMVQHSNVARLFGTTEMWFKFAASDIWTLFHSYSFDFSVWEIWGALLYGGRLIVVSNDIARSPDEFYALICREGVTVLNQTPSAFQRLISVQSNSGVLHRLRCVVFGGEALEPAMLKSWYERNCNRDTQLINMYGITETTVHVTYRPLGYEDTKAGGPSPIGCPLPDLRAYILDAYGEPVPVGVAGELYIGGVGVARGYLNRPDLTAERFVEDPFVAESGGRMYRTGDLGRWLPDGNIEFVGRDDFQVKIRGFRIELGEIEARLREHAGVREAVVVAGEDGDGGKRLVAYYTTLDEREEGVGAEPLRSHLSACLPEYMVPAAYVRLEAMPLTPNGKLDRKALPAPDADAYSKRTYEAPQGEIETRLAEIWAEVLKQDKIGRHDNFFELGGHSLLAVRLITRLRQALCVELAIRDLFAHPVFSLLAEKLIDLQLAQFDSRDIAHTFGLLGFALTPGHVNMGKAPEGNE